MRHAHLNTTAVILIHNTKGERSRLRLAESEFLYGISCVIVQNPTGHMQGTQVPPAASAAAALHLAADGGAQDGSRPHETGGQRRREHGGGDAAGA